MSDGNTHDSEFSWLAANLAQTERFARALTAHLPQELVIGLRGPLGAGKTRLVQAIGASLGMDTSEIVSPTFVLVRHYQSPGGARIHHADLYRVADADEFFEIGLEELWNEPGWCFIEWADRFAQFLPSDRLEIEIEPTGAESRRFIGRGLGPHSQAVAAALRESLAINE
jgi:tRNA threonylcarbamoyladenosine biosynthesis protein TsaE